MLELMKCNILVLILGVFFLASCKNEVKREKEMLIDNIESLNQNMLKTTLMLTNIDLNDKILRVPLLKEVEESLSLSESTLLKIELDYDIHELKNTGEVIATCKKFIKIQRLLMLRYSSDDADVKKKLTDEMNEIKAEISKQN